MSPEHSGARPPAHHSRERRQFDNDIRDRCRIWPKLLPQPAGIRQSACIEFGFDRQCQLGLAAAVMRHGQQLDGEPAGASFTFARQ
jgi:hypothetical protein